MPTSNTPQDGLDETQTKTSALPHHVQEFIDLSEALQAALERKNEVKITMARSKLKILFKTLDEKQQSDIQHVIQQEIAGLRIHDEQNTVNSTAHRILNVPVLGMRALAATVPQFTGATLELIVTTLGLGIYGIVKGLGKTIDTFNRKMAA